jgi:hypothetical protein
VRDKTVMIIYDALAGDSSVGKSVMWWTASGHMLSLRRLTFFPEYRYFSFTSQGGDYREGQGCRERVLYCL